MKTKLALKFLLAVSAGIATSTFAQTLSVSPNLVCVGQSVTVTLSGVCIEGGGYATVNGNAVALTDDGSGTWSGTYTTTSSDAGIKTCSASDDCEDTFNTVSLTVVELNDITFVSGPAHSGWTQQYGDPVRDYAALKSPTNGDVVTFGLDMTPHNTNAATLVSWSGATALSGNLTATVPGDSISGPTTVTASDASCTTTPYTVWIFWGTISYNCSGALDGSDALDFAAPLGLADVPGGKKVAGDGSGTEIKNGNTWMLAINKVEIVGTLSPSGVGAIVGNVFTFNSQIRSSSPTWQSSTAFASSATPTATAPAQNDGDLPQQTTPISDKIFALDSPGAALGSGSYYLGMACNFTDYIYIGGVKASDAGQWYSHTQAELSSGTVTDITHNAGSGSPTLPTTWGDSNW